MEQILERLLSRPGVEQAQMAGAAVRGHMNRDRAATMAGLTEWCGHDNRFVRIASGVGCAVVGTRDRNALADVLPYVERLANDDDPVVREHGAQAALEELWLMHTDALSAVVEQWMHTKNDRVREVIVHTIARVATGDMIRRPSLLRRFIEQGLSLCDLLVPNASPDLRKALATNIDRMGSLAPELVSPFVREWSQRIDYGSLELVAALEQLPFLATVDDLDLASVHERLSKLHGESQREAAELARSGAGELDYTSITADSLLEADTNRHVPWSHVADPYRGCQLRCEFCNARSPDEWVVDGPGQFRRRVGILHNAADLLAAALASGDMEPRDEHVICIGNSCDPYQPAEERSEVTRAMLEVCLKHEHPVIVQTRLEMVLRDTDILARLAKKGLVNVLVSMQTAVEGIRNKTELGTSTIAERFRTMRMLTKAGIPVGLLLSPIMPELTDDPELLEDVIRQAGQAGALWVVAQVLNLQGSARVKVKLFLDELVPALLPKYEKLYAGSAKARRADPAYSKPLVLEKIPDMAKIHRVDDTSRMLTGGKDVRYLMFRP